MIFLFTTNIRTLELTHFFRTVSLGHSQKLSFVSLFWNETFSALSKILFISSFMGEQKELSPENTIRLSIDSLIV